MRFVSRCVLAACVALLLGASPAHGGDVLPDLDQMSPGGLVVKKRVVDGRRAFRLGFSSAAANVGAGPLMLHGYRRTLIDSEMQVDQLVDQDEGAARLIRDVGLMSYVVHPDHKHWHLLGFERYEIRSGDGSASVGKDRKSGFCLGDRFALPDAESLKAFSPTPLQGDTCGLGQPHLKSLFAGISVGWADRYAAHLEGQFIDVTGVRSGTYVLVHRLNLEGKIAESNYLNNASSVRFRLRWRRDRSRPPAVRVVARCPSSDACPAATQ